MFSKTLLVFLVFNLVLKYSYGQRDKKFFRKDYSYLEALEGFYKFHMLSKTWSEAIKVCALEGASLFYPENENEAKAVIAWSSTQSFHYLNVGISDLLVEGLFETIDGIPLSDVYNKWASGEPNNADGGENCVVMSKEGTLNDENCSKKFPYICKKTLRSLEWNNECNMPNLDYKFDAILGRCYKFHLDPMSWTDAYAVCSAEQSYLAVINSQSEADCLVTMIDTAPKDHVFGSYLRGAVHVGFHNKGFGGWRTVRGGTTVDESGYAKWGNNQPDGGDKEQCGSIFYNGHLNDISCDTRCFFICEHEVDTLQTLTGLTVVN